MMQKFSVRACLPLLALSLLAGACTSGSGRTTSEGAVKPACTPQQNEKAAKAVLRCTESSIAYVETEAASGTGVVFEEAGRRYIVTNQHVVDPFNAADATIGRRVFDELPVVGVDTGADIAVLGPLSGEKLPPALQIADGTGLERGDELFLVGFPGESHAAEDLEATIASGIVSRLRKVKEFGHAYIQTDASIGGGQSGGPLFDSTSHVVGISGLSFAEEFALALTGRDAKAAIDRILTGAGDAYLSVPPVSGGDGLAASGSVRLTDASDGQVLFLPAAAQERTWHFTVDMDSAPIVSITNLLGDDILAASGNSTSVQGEVARQLAALRGGRPEDLFDPSAEGLDPKLAERETRPGSFTIPVKADTSAVVFIVAPMTDSPLDVKWQSDLPLAALSRPVAQETIEVGGQVDRVFGGFDTAVDVLVELAEGQEVELYARSPQGDPGFAVYGPNDKLDNLTVADPEGAGIEVFDDTEDGLYGLDAKTTYQSKTAGTHRFRVYSNDFSATRIRFSVTDCPGGTCQTEK